MTELLESSLYFGVFLSLGAYFLGVMIHNKWKSPLTNPMILAIVAVTGVLLLLKIDYQTYYDTAQHLSWCLTPATVCLAVPLYRQLNVLRQHFKAILAGIFSGVLASALSVFLLCLVFGLSHTDYVTLLPKSVTTAIGMSLSQELGGIPAITVAAIVVTGIGGNCSAVFLCKLFRITDPVAKGIAIGTTSHAIGTAKALEMGEVEGAMSGLSIAVCGLMTVLCAQVFAGLL